VKRVFVTGASGFIGAAVARQLVAQGIPTAVLLRPMSEPSRLGDSLRKLTVIEGSFHEPVSYTSALAEFAPDTVFHLAWYGVGRSQRDDPEQVRVNVPGTLDLFLACRQAGARSFIAAGSQAEYGPSDRRIDEEHPTHPVTLYGTAKLATLVILKRIAAAHAVRLAWLRLFSVYGPRDDEGTLIGSLVRQLLAGDRPVVTTGTQRWDYLHVDDAAAAFLAVAKSGAAGVFNVGAGVAPPLRDTIALVRDLVDPTLEIGFGEVPLGPGAVTRLEPDVSRLRAVTGWAPRISVEDGLRGTIEWQRERRVTEVASDVLVDR
jgi:UDP-glucose 4-epimerase